LFNLNSTTLCSFEGELKTNFKIGQTFTIKKNYNDEKTNNYSYALLVGRPSNPILVKKSSHWKRPADAIEQNHIKKYHDGLRSKQEICLPMNVRRLLKGNEKLC